MKSDPEQSAAPSTVDGCFQKAPSIPHTKQNKVLLQHESTQQSHVFQNRTSALRG